ncbi:hypothetical protein [Pseudomonas sp. SIMBA_021]|uniref:hypothetical protein n=1 Tax=unclassified Pseudomonas TaxID=196821 RepID=UPI00397C2276
MSSIPFSDRELRRAWRELSEVCTPQSARKNAHRLLLFYAVECGLKAIWLKRQSRTLFTKEDIERTGHDLREIVKELRLGAMFVLPQSLQLSPAVNKGLNLPRNGDITILHQAWRYGGQCMNPGDAVCENQLVAILAWINKEIAA